ncbi:MAG: tRNA uridine-5-carboxymethylaminomethyl(34) synthesis GTPase MnmE [Bacteroidota bacterium]
MSSPTGDTIAAVATPAGNGALSIIRISGPASLSVADRVFRGTRPLSGAAGFTLHQGVIVDPDGGVLDEVLVSVYRGPRSYTGEDSVEITCHGGMLVTRSVLEAVLASGARQAGPGEFTRRAFLGGRISLTQAEAVMDLISARGERARRQSVRQLRGETGRALERMRSALVRLCGLLELELDFSEDDPEAVPRDEVKAGVVSAIEECRRLEASYERARLERDGIRVAITGAPNAGKSSIFNRLLSEDRAIVHPVPGTTRDTLEGDLSIEGIPVRLTDTAGLRESEDPVEAEGIRRAREAVESADLVIAVEEPGNTGSTYKSGEVSKPTIRVVNKIDLDPKLRPGQDSGHVYVSALMGDGFESLRRSMAEFLLPAGNMHGESTITSLRHLEAIRRAEYSLEACMVSIGQNLPSEFIALDLRRAAESIGEITGAVTSEEVLNAIFERFCIGK